MKQVRWAIVMALIVGCLLASVGQTNAQEESYVGTVEGVVTAQSLEATERETRAYEDDSEQQLKVVRGSTDDSGAVTLAEAARDDAQRYAREARESARQSRRSAYVAKCKAYEAARFARAVARNVHHRRQLRVQRHGRQYRWQDAGESGVVSEGRLTQILDARIASVKAWVSETFATKDELKALNERVVKLEHPAATSQAPAVEQPAPEAATPPTEEPIATAPTEPIDWLGVASWVAIPIIILVAIVFIVSTIRTGIRERRTPAPPAAAEEVMEVKVPEEAPAPVPPAAPAGGGGPDPLGVI